VKAPLPGAMEAAAALAASALPHSDAMEAAAALAEDGEDALGSGWEPASCQLTTMVCASASTGMQVGHALVLDMEATGVAAVPCAVSGRYVECAHLGLGGAGRSAR
jgi:hypothetical protein